MNTSNSTNSQGFYRSVATAAIAGSMSLVVAAASIPTGTERGDLVVYGHAALIAGILAAFVARAVYARSLRRVPGSLQRLPRFGETAA